MTTPRTRKTPAAASKKKAAPQTEELAVFDPSRYALANFEESGLAEALDANLGGDAVSPSDFDVVKVPAGGGLQWTTFDELGREVDVPALVGIVVYQHTARTFWKKSIEDGESGPPDCFSNDGVTGRGDNGTGLGVHECASCPMNQYGTAQKGEGKACKETRVLYLLREGELLPTVVRVPPSSLKDYRRFMLRLTSKGVPYYKVAVELTLERDKNAQGITYSKVAPAQVERLSGELAESAVKYKRLLEALMASATSSVMVAEVVDEAEPDDEVEDPFSGVKPGEPDLDEA